MVAAIRRAAEPGFSGEGRRRAEKTQAAERKRKFPRTTDSRHAYPVHANLLRNLAIHRPNQVWVADITCIRLADEFVYLAVGALRMALGKRTAPAGLIHHSDRGVRELHQNAEAGAGPPRGVPA